MTLPVLVLCTANLLLIAALPRLFFRRGRLNVAWWLTAAPFLLAGVVLVAALAGVVPAVTVGAGAVVALHTLAGLFAAGSIGLIAFAVGSHAAPVSLWHQPEDTPDRLVTRGAYARIRHPLYAAFLLALLACFAAVPHAGSAAALALGFLRLNRTAAREERRLLVDFGAPYRDYMARTGRFLPRLTRAAVPIAGGAGSRRAM